MTATKIENTGRQRGSALILVLIALSLGSLLITPTLGYVSTGLTEAGISEEQLLEEYALDAAVEYTLWQLKYNVDGLTDLLDPDNPSSSTSITVNGIEVPVTTAISQSPEGDSDPFPVLPSQSGVYLAVAMAIIPPGWVEPGGIAYFTHLVYIYNYGTAQANLKALFQQLDPALTYVEESYDGPDADLTATYVDDHWELDFDFSNPLPILEPQESIVVSFVTSVVEDGTGEYNYSSTGLVSYAGFSEGVEYSSESGLTSFGLYDITATIGSDTILVNVGVTETGELVVRSWQIQ